MIEIPNKFDVLLLFFYFNYNKHKKTFHRAINLTLESLTKRLIYTIQLLRYFATKEPVLTLCLHEERGKGFPEAYTD